MYGLDIVAVMYWSLIISVFTGPPIIAPLSVFLCSLLSPNNFFYVNHKKNCDVIGCGLVCTVLSFVWIPLLMLVCIVVPFVFSLTAAAKAGNAMRDKVIESLKNLQKNI